MPLKQHVAEQKAKEPGFRTNPEVDAKIDAFIQENPKLYEYYKNLSHEQLVRKAMLGKMQRSEYTNTRNEEIKAWVEENPDIKAQIEKRIRNVPAENRERAYIAAAKRAAMEQTMQAAPRIRP